jgi:cytochrome P450
MSELVVRRPDMIHEVLADERFIVAPAEPGAPAGTVAWLRASVSRFCNGPEHQRRRALVVAELAGLDPAALRTAARDGGLAALARHNASEDGDVLAGLARTVPTAVLAARFGAADPGRAAAAIGAVAGAYFPGAGEAAVRAADAAVSDLLDMLAGPQQDVVVARITIMVQGYDATANLIAAAVGLLPELPGAVTTDELLARTAYGRPPVRALRRVAREPAELGDLAAAAGDTVVCDVEAVSREPGQDGAGDRPAAAALTFGYGLRPCPGPSQALALAAGIIDAVRQGASG